MIIEKSSTIIEDIINIDSYKILIEGYTSMTVLDNKKWVEINITGHTRNPAWTYGTEFNKEQLKEFIELLNNIYNKMR